MALTNFCSTSQGTGLSKAKAVIGINNKIIVGCKALILKLRDYDFSVSRSLRSLTSGINFFLLNCIFMARLRP